MNEWIFCRRSISCFLPFFLLFGALLGGKLGVVLELVKGVDCVDKEDRVDCEEKADWAVKVGEFLLVPVKVAVAFPKSWRYDIRIVPIGFHEY